MNKRILITGTSRGIGKYLVNYYTSLGYSVIGCSRNEVNYTFGNYEHFICDISDEKSVKQIFRTISKAHGGIDILINNAGIASMNHSLLTEISTVKNIFDTNLIGSFLFSREAAKLMQKNKCGRIINFSTVAVPLALEGEAIYASSKAAVISLTKTLSKELSNFGITVNAIGPTPVKTDLIKNIPTHKIDRIISQLSSKSYTSIDDILNILDFFMKKESQLVNGQIIYLG